MTQQMLYELYALVAAEEAAAGATAWVAAQRALKQLAELSTEGKAFLHAEYRQKYPALGGL